MVFGWLRASVTVLLFLLLFAPSTPLRAQSTPSSPQGEPPEQSQEVQKPAAGAPGFSPSTAADEPAPGTTQSNTSSQTPENDRIFYALPNYLTVEKSTKLPPLTAKQKFKLVALGTFDPLELAFIGLETFVYQAENQNPTLGQGVVGYAKRYGLASADNVIGNFGTGAIFPSLLHQDPRYYQMGKGNFFHRLSYAGSRVVITRGDGGKNQFNFSEFLGDSLAAGAANAYHPAPHTLDSNLSVCFTQMGWDAIAYEMKEFWPDIHRRIQRHKPRA